MMEKIVNFKNYTYKGFENRKIESKEKYFFIHNHGIVKTKAGKIDENGSTIEVAFQCLAFVQQSVNKTQLICRKKVKMTITCTGLRDNYEFS